MKGDAFRRLFRKPQRSTDGRGCCNDDDDDQSIGLHVAVSSGEAADFPVGPVRVQTLPFGRHSAASTAIYTEYGNVEEDTGRGKVAFRLRFPAKPDIGSPAVRRLPPCYRSAGIDDYGSFPSRRNVLFTRINIAWFKCMLKKTNYVGYTW